MWCTPQTQDIFNLAIIIKEWRRNDDGDYFMVGYVERDMQVAIGICSNNPPHILLNNIDTCIIAGASLSNMIMANDVNGDNITLSANGGPFAFSTNPAMFISTPGNSVTSGTFSLNSNYSHIQKQPYQITVKAIDSNPSVNLVHFKTFNVRIIPEAPLNLSTISSNDHILLNWNKPASYLLTNKNAFERYRVYRKDGLSTWVHGADETVPPTYTGFVLIGANTGVSDTSFYDYNSAMPFVSGQDYSYVILAEYSDGVTSYASNISSKQVFVGIRELALNSSDIKISPNPINDNFTITFNLNNANAFTIELYDVCNRKIKTFLDHESITNKNTNLNLGNISEGIYFLKITDHNNTTITKKIIKQ
jgi:hypothetical protein